MSPIIATVDVDRPAAEVFAYATERPHRGYRTQGRVPAAIFYTDRPDPGHRDGWNPNDIPSGPPEPSDLILGHKH